LRLTLRRLQSVLTDMVKRFRQLRDLRFQLLAPVALLEQFPQRDAMILRLWLRLRRLCGFGCGCGAASAGLGGSGCAGVFFRRKPTFFIARLRRGRLRLALRLRGGSAGFGSKGGSSLIACW
jgi:hypothetical protein